MKLLSFHDLRAAGIVANRTTLMRWQRDHGFPTGRLCGPNSRRWTEEEIQAWVSARPQIRESTQSEAAA